MNTPSPSRLLTPLRRRSTHLRISRLILPSKLRLAFRACVSFLFLHLLLEVVYYLIATEKKIGVNLYSNFVLMSLWERIQFSQSFSLDQKKESRMFWRPSVQQVVFLCSGHCRKLSRQYLRQFSVFVSDQFRLAVSLWLSPEEENCFVCVCLFPGWVGVRNTDTM